MLAVLLAAGLVASCAVDRGPTWSFRAPPSAGLPGADVQFGASPSPLAGASVSPSESSGSGSSEVDLDKGDDGDEGLEPVYVGLTPQDGRIQVYADQPSILPGEPLRLHTSTTSATYGVEVYREATPPVEVFEQDGYTGHDYRALGRLEAATHTARAGWPVSITIPTTGWLPGVYTVAARDCGSRASGTVFAVRSPAIDADDVLYVLPVMTYQAYNLWGSYDFYTTTRAYKVSFDRPYAQGGGLSYYPAYDRRILRWLLEQGYELAFTTDYDLSIAPPAVARAVVFPQHVEYVSRALFDWVDDHVNVRGDLNVAVLGANSFYWQVRLQPSPSGAGRPLDIVCYKTASLDPLAAKDPDLATVRWRAPLVNRPESRLFGAMYSGIVDGGHTRHDATVTGLMPSFALDGTGWGAGTRLSGYLYGEADMADPATGVLAGTTGTAPYLGPGTSLVANMTFRQSAAGGRAFDAGTFIFGAALDGSVQLGVTTESFDRFARNVLTWLGAIPSP